MFKEFIQSDTHCFNLQLPSDKHLNPLGIAPYILEEYIKFFFLYYYNDLLSSLVLSLRR